MNDHTGKFVWYEWMGEDLQGAADFYGHVVGWKIGDPGMASFPYKVGAVKEAAKALNNSVDEAADEQEEVSGWIATIAKAMLSLLK